MVIVVRLTDRRLYRLGWRMLGGRNFTITVPEHSVRHHQKWRVALITAASHRITWYDDYVDVDPGGRPAIIAIARVRRSGRPSTTDDRLSFAEPVVLDPPLRLSELLRRIPSSSRPAAREAIHDDIVELDGPLQREVLKGLTAARPDLADVVERLSRYQDEPVRTEEAPALNLERDSFRLAMKIAGFDPRDAGEWTGQADGGYLDRLAYTPREEIFVDYDAARFPDWEELPGPRVDWHEFADGSHRLRIGNVNATPLEEVLGVDLIYRHLDNDTFVLVQYKKMTRSSSGTWGYRPDKQLAEEMRRMRRVDKAPVAGGDPATWRLYPRGCFVKLVRANLTFDPYSDRLLAGIYLPVLYLDEILASGAAVGPRGGPWLSYETIDRYLTSETFVDLVRQGWVGTRGVTSHAIARIVDRAVSLGRSVMLAEESGEERGVVRRRSASS